jgi:hypothetical protein
MLALGFEVSFHAVILLFRLLCHWLASYVRGLVNDHRNLGPYNVAFC